MNATVTHTDLDSHWLPVNLTAFPPGLAHVGSTWVWLVMSVYFLSSHLVTRGPSARCCVGLLSLRDRGENINDQGPEGTGAASCLGSIEDAPPSGETLQARGLLQVDSQKMLLLQR